MSRLSDLIRKLLEGLVRPSPKPPKPPGPPEPGPNGSIAVLRVELLAAHNRERASGGVSGLSSDDKLDLSAQNHATWMAENQRMDHLEGQMTFADRIQATGYKMGYGGENIAMGQPTVDAVMTAWMNSPGHRQNILKTNYKDAGFGIGEAGGRRYWCANFAAPRTWGQAFADVRLPVFVSGPLGPSIETLASGPASSS